MQSIKVAVVLLAISVWLELLQKISHHIHKKPNSETLSSFFTTASCSTLHIHHAAASTYQDNVCFCSRREAPKFPAACNCEQHWRCRGEGPPCRTYSKGCHQCRQQSRPPCLPSAAVNSESSLSINSHQYVQYKNDKWCDSMNQSETLNMAKAAEHYYKVHREREKSTGLQLNQYNQLECFKWVIEYMRCQWCNVTWRKTHSSRLLCESLVLTRLAPHWSWQKTTSYWWTFPSPQNTSTLPQKTCIATQNYWGP